MSAKSNKTTTEPSLADLLNLHKKDIMQSMNCHAIATVQSFDSAKQTVTATINYKKTYYRGEDPVLIDYPLLVDVPAIFLGGGASSLTFPVAQGDECLILFNDRDMDNWFAGQAPLGVATPRLHSFADGIALVGLRSAPKVITGFDGTRVDLRNDKAHVAVGPDLIKIYNDVTTLKTVINGLIDLIAAATVSVSVPSTPTVVVTGLVNAGSISSYKSTVEGLLE